MTTVVLLLMLLAGTTQGRAADHVRLTINDGLADMTLKAKMENAVSELLTELNYAAEQNRKPRLNGLAMTEQAKSDVMRLWDNVHLYCFEPEVVQKCLTTMHGYQVRGLPVVMIPVGEDESKQEYQEVVVSFSKKGEMESFFLTIAMHLYQEVMKNS